MLKLKHILNAMLHLNINGFKLNTRSRGSSSLLSSLSCKVIEETLTLRTLLLFFSNEGEGNPFLLLGFLVERTDFQMSRNRRYVGHVP